MQKEKLTLVNFKVPAKDLQLMRSNAMIYTDGNLSALIRLSALYPSESVMKNYAKQCEKNKKKEKNK